MTEATGTGARTRPQPADLWSRFVATLLDCVIAAYTIFVGWAIWFAFLAPRGQTPGKKLLGLRLARTDGTVPRAGVAWAREVALKFGLFTLVPTLAFNAIAEAYLGFERNSMDPNHAFDNEWVTAVGLLTFFGASLSAVPTKSRRAIWDLMAGTYVVATVVAAPPPPPAIPPDGTGRTATRRTAAATGDGTSTKFKP